MEDDDFTLQLRQIVDLAFVLEKDIEEAFKILTESHYFKRMMYILIDTIKLFSIDWGGLIGVGEEEVPCSQLKHGIATITTLRTFSLAIIMLLNTIKYFYNTTASLF